MKIIVNDHVYGMTRKQMNLILKIASKNIPFGIYAIEKDGVCELKKEKFESGYKLKQTVSDYEKKGFKVMYNGKSR